MAVHVSEILHNGDESVIIKLKKWAGTDGTGNSSETISSTAIDVYGQRLATVSGDDHQGQIKIWGSNGATWKLTASWQAHPSAVVTSIAWAHPEFGILLASGSSDHSCKVWQEDSSSSSKHHHGTSTRRSTSTRTTTSTTTTMGIPYVVKATLTESTQPVTCVQFAPRHWGLQLATGSSD
jgi:nucleoporin SEH1